MSEHKTSVPMSGVRRKFWLADVLLVGLQPNIVRRTPGDAKFAANVGRLWSTRTVGSIVKPPSAIVAIVLLLQPGEGVPCQNCGIRCGSATPGSAESIVPVPLIICGPGVEHGGGVCDV
jgi:hypothetical protein